MKCEDVLLELEGSVSPSEAVEAHLAGCADCRTAAQAVEYAALPPLSGSERALLSELAPATRKAWLLVEHRRLEHREWWKQAARLAVAAGLGALVATGTLTLRGSRAPAVTEPLTVKRAVLEAGSSTETPSDEANLSDDEVFFEVSWPQATEGDL